MKNVLGLSVRGMKFVGKVISDKAKKTVVVEIPLTKYISKYRRWAKTRSRLVAHNPDKIGAKIGDIVEIMETRRKSKTKSKIVIRIIKKGREG